MSWIIYTTNQNWPNLSYRDWSHFLPELQIWVGSIQKMTILSSEMLLVSWWFDEIWLCLAFSRNFSSNFRWCDEIFTRTPCWSLHDWSSAFIPTHLWNESGKIFTKYHAWFYEISRYFTKFSPKMFFFTDFRSRRQS